MKTKTNGRLKPEDAEKLVQAVIVENRLYGVIMADDEINNLRDYVNGRVTNDEYVTWVLDHIGASI